MFLSLRVFFIINFLAISIVNGQSLKSRILLTDTSQIVTHNVRIKPDRLNGKRCLNVLDNNPEDNSEYKLAILAELNFKDGLIQVELAGEPMNNALTGARGFVGIAFRLNESTRKFECIYLRPTNGRALDQVRRNHSVQYISYPDHPWFKLREDFPEKYESYVDIGPKEWIKLKIEVIGNTAKLFVNNAKEPVLIVSDLKHGENALGKIGLWIGPGTNACFRNLTVIHYDDNIEKQ